MTGGRGGPHRETPRSRPLARAPRQRVCRAPRTLSQEPLGGGRRARALKPGQVCAWGSGLMSLGLGLPLCEVGIPAHKVRLGECLLTDWPRVAPGSGPRPGAAGSQPPPLAARPHWSSLGPRDPFSFGLKLEGLLRRWRNSTERPSRQRLARATEAWVEATRYCGGGAGREQLPLPPPP